MPQKRVLLVGDVGHGDFREAVAWLRATCQLAEALSLDEALQQLTDHAPPHAVIIAQARPGRLRAQQVERLHAASPVSRLVALLGSWCEGEMRTGRPWPGVIRVYWHQWQAQFVRELSPDEAGEHSLWSLPRTASFGERVEQSTRQLYPPQPGPIAIRTASWATFDGLRDACRQLGCQAVWLQSASEPIAEEVSAVLWDGISCDAPAAAELRALAARFPARRLVALLDYVRRQDYEQALAAGATTVLAKPFLVADLLALLAPPRVAGN